MSPQREHPPGPAPAGENVTEAEVEAAWFAAAPSRDRSRERLLEIAASPSADAALQKSMGRGPPPPSKWGDDTESLPMSAAPRKDAMRRHPPRGLAPPSSCPRVNVVGPNADKG